MNRSPRLIAVSILAPAMLVLSSPLVAVLAQEAAVPVSAPPATPSPVEAAPDDYSVFDDAQEVSTFDVSYDEIVGFLNSHSVIEKGRVKVNYGSIRAGGASTLTQIIRDMRDVPVNQLSRRDQLAYWLNLRNLLVLFAVTLEGRESIAEERGTVATPGEMWTKELITVSGVSLSINDIERNILLANWQSPNLIYGFYQGTEGGPALYKPGFSGATVDDVLEKLGQRYVNTKNTLRAKSSTLLVPAVYDWYKDDLFKGSDAAVFAHIKKLASPKLKSKLEKFDGYEPAEFSYKVESVDKLTRVRARTSAPPPQSRVPSGGSTGRSGS